MMKRIILLFIAATAIPTLIGAMASAGTDTFSVNLSGLKGEGGITAVTKYAPFALNGNGYCTGVPDISSGTDCEAHGKEAVSAWLNGSFMDQENSSFVPAYNSRPWSGYTAQMQAMPFGVGQGLPQPWLDTLYSSTSQFANPFTAIDTDSRDEWMDQIVINYLQSQGNNFAQNFRTQVAFGNNWDIKGDGKINRDGLCRDDEEFCTALIDQRLEQGGIIDQNGDPGNASGNTIQAFQQAFGATSGSNISGDPAFGMTLNQILEAQNAVGMGQNIEQAAQGFFYSCLNCNVDNEHAFVPPEKIEHQEWSTRPKITQINHADTATQTTWTP